MAQGKRKAQLFSMASNLVEGFLNNSLSIKEAFVSLQELKEAQKVLLVRERDEAFRQGFASALNWQPKILSIYRLLSGKDAAFARIHEATENELGNCNIVKTKGKEKPLKYKKIVAMACTPGMNEEERIEASKAYIESYLVDRGWARQEERLLTPYRLRMKLKEEFLNPDVAERRYNNYMEQLGIMPYEKRQALAIKPKCPITVDTLESCADIVMLDAIHKDILLKIEDGIIKYIAEYGKIESEDLEIDCKMIIKKSEHYLDEEIAEHKARELIKNNQEDKDMLFVKKYIYPTPKELSKFDNQIADMLCEREESDDVCIIKF